MTNYKELVKDLRELTRMKEEIDNEITALQDTIKNEMTATNNFSIIGDDFKITWFEVTSNRLDTTAIKKELPEIAARYTKTSTTRRFCLS